MRSPQIIAHRGASGHRPEHGLAAYRLAIELGADAIEPDIVASRDGVLLLRHENEISGTTDVAAHPEFADRRRTQEVDGVAVSGWFTEDFTWPELATLRIRERLPELRPGSAAHDGEGGIQRLTDLLRILDDEAGAARSVALVAEIKHATHFASIGLPLDELVAGELTAAGWSGDPRLTVESFEQGVLGGVRRRGIRARYVYLVDGEGAAPDLVASRGSSAPTYQAQLAESALPGLAASLDGISVPKTLLLDERGEKDARLVDRAHAAGLQILTWTLRPENAFLQAPHRTDAPEAPDPAAHGDWRSEWRAVAETGVDGVFTDFPGLARDLLGVGGDAYT